MVAPQEELREQMGKYHDEAVSDLRSSAFHFALGAVCTLVAVSGVGEGKPDYWLSSLGIILGGAGCYGRAVLDYGQASNSRGKAAAIEGALAAHSLLENGAGAPVPSDAVAPPTAINREMTL